MKANFKYKINKDKNKVYSEQWTLFLDNIETLYEVVSDAKCDYDFKIPTYYLVWDNHFIFERDDLETAKIKILDLAHMKFTIKVDKERQKIRDRIISDEDYDEDYE